MALTIDSLYQQNLELQDRLRIIEDALRRLRPGDVADPGPFDRARYARKDYLTDPPPDQFQTNPIVDPVPPDLRHRYCCCPYHRYWPPWPPPYADPVPRDLVRRPYAVDREKMWWLDPTPVDPVPWEFYRIPIVDLIRKFRGTDKITIDSIADLRVVDLIPGVIPPGGETDPAPDDLARLSKVDLEAVQHRINSEMIRWKSLDKRVSELMKAGTRTKGRKRQ